MLARLFRARPQPPSAAPLYEALVAAARQPEFYLRLGVPDTPAGRFELIQLHAHLVLRRLRGAGEAGRALGQALFDLMFADLDQSLREMGIGDVSVGPKVKDAAKAFYGRIAAYDAGLDADDEGALAAAIARNLLRGADGASDAAAALAIYARAVDAALAGQGFAELAAGDIRLPAPAGAAPAAAGV